MEAGENASVRTAGTPGRMAESGGWARSGLPSFNARCGIAFGWNRPTMDRQLVHLERRVAPLEGNHFVMAVLTPGDVAQGRGTGSCFRCGSVRE